MDPVILDGKMNVVRFLSAVKSDASSVFDGLPHGYRQLFPRPGASHRGKSWVLVGNGPLDKDCSRLVDGNHNSRTNVGTKTSILFLNGRSWKHILENREDGVLNIIVERTAQNYELNYDPDWRDGSSCSLDGRIMARLQGLPETTIGFVAALLLHRLVGSIVLLGFDVTGHQDNPKQLVWRANGHEHVVLDRLMEKAWFSDLSGTTCHSQKVMTTPAARSVKLLKMVQQPKKKANKYVKRMMFASFEGS